MATATATTIIAPSLFTLTCAIYAVNFKKYKCKQIYHHQRHIELHDICDMHYIT
jgi:hypothetical protein